MTVQNSMSAFKVSTLKSTPQLLLKPVLFQTHSMCTRNKWTMITTPERLKLSYSHRSKPKDSLLSHINNFYLEDEKETKHAQLVKRVRKSIHQDKDDSFQNLVMIDALQQLGIDSLFEDEIYIVLKKHYIKFTSTDFCKHRNLYEVSLSFRILRHNGFHVSADAFETFKGTNGMFEEELKNDIRGLRELYEASQLSIEGESILDAAANFSCHTLEEKAAFLDHDQARMIKYTLENPCRKCLSVFNVKNSMKDFNGTALQELAELHFTMVQSTHRMELNQISSWWKNVGLHQELKLARDQPSKWYLWSMAALPNPILSKQRVDLTKVISLIYVIDDIFDVYGTLEGVTLFTEAIKRWDMDAVEQAPYYMRASLKVLYDVTNEIAYKVYEKHGFNPINTLHHSWATLCKAFLEETNWFVSGHLPKAEEYLKNGIVSSGVHVVLVHMFFLIGDGTTEEQASLINHHNGLISNVAKILRLWVDLGNAQDEKQDGHDGSYVKCFLKEYEGYSMTSAREHVLNMIEDTWKCINKSSLSPNAFSTTFTKGSINIARMVPLMYSYNDVGSLPLLEEHINYMLGEGL